MKILTVIGARPQFIKAIALSRAISARNRAEEVIVHTGQHYNDNMSQVFFEDLEIPKPKYRFNLGSLSHAEMTGRQMIEIERVLLEERPDICLVYGDTNSTLAASLAAAKLHIDVAHVEAGLRSFNKRMPEEINRIVSDQVSRWLFAPTQTAVDNLRREGFAADAVHLVGDVMYDVTRLFTEDGTRKTDIVSRLGLASGRYAVSTLHRQENTDDAERLGEIIAALSELSAKLPVVLPLHPRTVKVIAGRPDLAAQMAKLIVVEPLGFFDMASLLSEAAVAITDSGGLQKEAYFHGVPCVTVRDETEWTELVELGWNRLPATLSRQDILAAVDLALAQPGRSEATPYGDGEAAGRILDVLMAESGL